MKRVLALAKVGGCSLVFAVAGASDAWRCQFVGKNWPLEKRERNGEIRSGGRRDLGMDTALYVARIIHHDLAVAQAKSWQWWTAITQVDFKDGLIYLDDGSEGDNGKMGGNVPSLMQDGVVRESKLLWALGNFSRFIRPGMVRVKCDLGMAGELPVYTTCAETDLETSEQEGSGITVPARALATICFSMNRR